MRFVIKPISEDWIAVASILPKPLFLNVWRASGRRAWSLAEPGSVALLVRPDNPQDVLGFGMIHGKMLTYLSQAWSHFGRNNGAESLSAMQLQANMERNNGAHDDPVIGNTVLINPVFMPPDKPFRLSQRFLSAAERRTLTDKRAPTLVSELRLHAASNFEPRLDERRSGYTPREPEVSADAQDQDFWPVVEASSWSAYSRRCAVTAWKADVTLRVAHIRPLGHGGSVEVPNTLLLRSELVDLYNAYLITFNEDGKLLVHADLGRIDPKAYGDLAQRSLRMPKHERDRPCLEHVAWRLNGPFVTRSLEQSARG